MGVGRPSTLSTLLQLVQQTHNVTRVHLPRRRYTTDNSGHGHPATVAQKGVLVRIQPNALLCGQAMGVKSLTR